jgi:hypothetical protein
MTDSQYTVIIVHSTGHAIRIEKLLQGEGIPCKLIPVPRQISSNCGLCIRILRSAVDVARKAIDAAQVEIEGVYDI